MDEYDDRNYRADYRPEYGDDRNYRADYRGSERADYRGNERAYRGYDDRNYRGGSNRRSYRNNRDQSYYEELEMVMEDMREQYRKLEDVADMAEGQDRNMLMKIAQKEKENYMYVKQLMEK